MEVLPNKQLQMALMFLQFFISAARKMAFNTRILVIHGMYGNYSGESHNITSQNRITAIMYSLGFGGGLLSTECFPVIYIIT